jgi:putative ABC transport system permease protein
MLAAIGIPIGLLAGLAGTFAVFTFAGEGIGMLIDQEAFAKTGFSTIAINPAVLALSALLAVITVFISATIPAWRASRISAVDAIRGSRDVRPSRRERREMRKNRRARARGTSFGRIIDNLRLRAAGVPGLLAHRNLTRASAKGRVAVASLAVSVALIIISGGISHYLNYLTQVVDSGGSDIEVSLNRRLELDETTSDGLKEIDDAYRAFATVDGAIGEGYMLLTSLCASFEPGMIDYGELSSQSEHYDMPDRGMTDDGTVYAPASVLFLDDASWNQILDENSLDRKRFGDPKNPVAVALNGTQSNDGKRYSVRDLFSSTGTANLLTNIASAENAMFVEAGVDDGEPVARYEGYGEGDEARFDENGEPIYGKVTRPLDEVLLDSYDLPVGAIVKTFPSPIKAYASIWPTLVLPVSALPTLAASSEGIIDDKDISSLATPFAFHSEQGTYGNTMYAYLSFGAEDARAVEIGMNEIIADKITGSEWYRTYLTNNAEDARAKRLIGETVQLFINCFILITGAIAVANVFNTLTNSIILRRREFAMLKSIGMGQRAFWRMIALECFSYAWRGLAIGLALGAAITFFIYQAMMMSFEGLSFVVPFGWVIAAVGVVIAVLAVSTAYALRKSSSGSIVQTLREDAI